MGVNVKATRNVLILCSTMLTSAAVCLCGTIGWVDLIIPHVMRMASDPSYRSLIPVSMLAGACFSLATPTILPEKLTPQRETPLPCRPAP